MSEFNLNAIAPLRELCSLFIGRSLFVKAFIPYGVLRAKPCKHLTWGNALQRKWTMFMQALKGRKQKKFNPINTFHHIPHYIFSKKKQVFFLKCTFFVMLFLILNVIKNNANFRWLHRKHPIPVLPVKILIFFVNSFNPLGWRFFDFFNQSHNGNFSR